MQLCRQQWRRHSDIPLEVINLVGRLGHYSFNLAWRLDHYFLVTVASLSLGHPLFSAESEIVVTFRASSEVERQKWVTALELAKAKAIQVHLGRWGVAVKM